MMKFLSAAALLVAATTAQAQTVSTVVSDIEASGDIALASDGTIYAADFGPSLRGAGGTTIRRIAPDGTMLDPLNAEFGGASGNEVGPDGALYQSDVARGEVWRVAMDGTRTLLAEGLTTPVGVAPADDGVVYAVECMANAITRIDAGATMRIAEGGPLVCPNGLAFGPDGALYAVNFRDGGVVRVDPESGETSLVATLPGGGNGHIAWANERFYIASFRGHRIYSLTLDGEICHIAGSGEGGNADGAAMEATFFRPNGVAISADGDTLYTNTITELMEPADPRLHPNALRRIDGLREMLDCPPDRVVAE